jgi:hypothetical protein
MSVAVCGDEVELFGENGDTRENDVELTWFDFCFVVVLLSGTADNETLVSNAFRLALAGYV